MFFLEFFLSYRHISVNAQVIFAHFTSISQISILRAIYGLIFQVILWMIAMLDFW